MSSSRVDLERFVRAAAASVPAGTRVLDAGAGHAPYRRLFDHTRCEPADFVALPGKTGHGARRLRAGT